MLCRTDSCWASASEADAAVSIARVNSRAAWEYSPAFLVPQVAFVFELQRIHFRDGRFRTHAAGLRYVSCPPLLPIRTVLTDAGAFELLEH